VERLENARARHTGGYAGLHDLANTANKASSRPQQTTRPLGMFKGTSESSNALKAQTACSVKSLGSAPALGNTEGNIFAISETRYGLANNEVHAGIGVASLNLGLVSALGISNASLNAHRGHEQWVLL
jgi:hypothetical protein